MTTRWDFDFTHSNVDFSVRHLLVSKVRGRFNKWGGTLLYDEKDPTRSSVEVTIDAASVDTSEPQRDTHLRSADFFDVAKFPQLTFKSTGVEAIDGERLRVTGDLTIHGVTRPTVSTSSSAAASRIPGASTALASPRTPASTARSSESPSTRCWTMAGSRSARRSPSASTSRRRAPRSPRRPRAPPG